MDERKALREAAWRAVLSSDSGKIVVTDILAICTHWAPTTDPETRVRQQVAREILMASGLYPENRGSFPYEYVDALTRIKLQQPAPVPEVRKQSLLRRLLGRKN